MRFKKVITILFLSVACVFQKANSQSFIALSSGFSLDLTNKKPFYHIPVSLRMEPFERSGFFVEATYGIPFSRQSIANAYTANPGLQEKVALTETVRSNLFTINFGGEIHIYTTKKNNSFYLDISAGVSAQHFKVDYKNYDKVNYEVLNPDVNTDFSGLILSIAGVYNFHKRMQNMFVELHLQTPPLVSGLNYYALTYQVFAPLQLTFGYKLSHNKGK